MSVVAVKRGGAFGDLIMILNLIPQLKEKYDSVHFISPLAEDHMKIFIEDYLGVDKVASDLILPEQEYDQIFNPGGYNYDGAPIDPFPNHLLYYWGKEMGIDYPDFNALRSKAPPLPKKIKNQNSPSYITIQAKTEWSVFKNWWGWQDLVNKIKKEIPYLEIYQIGGPADPLLENIDGNFIGDSFFENLSAQAWSSVHLGLDSVFNHTSNIIWGNKGKTKSIIIFGSTQDSAYGYVHNKNICLHLPCQPCARLDPGRLHGDTGPQTPCINLVKKSDNVFTHACMDGVSVDLVYGNLLRVLKDKRLISLSPEIRFTLMLREHVERQAGSPKPEFVYE